MISTFLRATGSYLPEKVVRNADLGSLSLEAQELIYKKTGIVERRHAHDNEYTSDLAIKAASRCLERARIDPTDIDGIVLATSSPDRMQPATATRVQAELGAWRAFAFDINSVCSGSTYGIALCDAFIRSGMYRRILLVGAEVYSRILNKQDMSTYPFFGDGAGALLFEAGDMGAGVIHSCLATDGKGSEVITVPSGGTMLPYDKMTSPKQAYFRMRGAEVLTFSLDKGPKIIRRLLEETGVSMRHVRWFICHQANINIIRGIARELSLPEDRFYVNLDRYGNTAGASVLIALDEVVSNGLVEKGDLVVTVAFGGGLSWGANLIRI
ncbi:MAG: ketoacyl-ACP synthase III [Syntrophales bacterium]|nr:ketoacyl-ACP synthase III [Syntrophales bacterium]